MSLSLRTGLAAAGIAVLPAACMAGGAVGARPPAPVEAPAGAAYALPLGGPETISIAVTDCGRGCPVVNVMIDPDDYWQRTSEEGAYSGMAPRGLHAAVTAAFVAQGFDDAEGVLDITKDNPVACPKYMGWGRTYFIHLGRGATGQRINYDTACTGSLDARRAEKVVEALAELPDLSHILSGTVTLEDAMGDEE